MTKDEALKLALKALELVNIEFVCNGAHHAKKDRHEVGDECPVTDRYRQSIIAIKEALAQPDQEPVAIRYDFDGYGYQYIDFGTGSDWQTRVQGEPLYTAPPQIKGCAECGVNSNNHALYCVACAENYLKEKNT